jgi:hypothetical protein
MKTTIELPDALFHRAKVVAAQRKITLKQLMVDALEKELGGIAPHKPIELTPEQQEIYEICDLGYPVLKKRGVVVTNEMINQMREELGI